MCKTMISPFRLFFHVFEILIFWAVIGETGKKNKPKMKNNNCIHHVPYLRDSKTYDRDFWYNCVK